MEFSLRKIGKAHMKLHESELDSPVQLIFTPSGFNPELWQNQVRYFSRKYRTATFNPMESERNRDGELDCLENLLDSEEYSNAVVISQNLGNSLLRDIEPHESVIGTVGTGMFRDGFSRPPRAIYRAIWRSVFGSPKLASRMFFSDLTDYRVVKEFVETVNTMDYSGFRSYADSYRLKEPAGESMFIHAEEDRFSDVEHVRGFENSRISVLENAGTFSFWEKPQEFNKALDDYLRVLEDFVEAKELVKVKKNNMSLRDFEKEESFQERLRKEVRIER